MCQHHRRKRHLPRSVNRRDVLRFATAGMGLVALGPLTGRWTRDALGAPGAFTRFVVVNLIGGNDGLNTVVPITLQPYYDRRLLGQAGSIAIPPGSELPLTTGPNPTTLYGLHPAMPNLASMWADGDLALVQKVGYPTPNLSHFESADIYSYAVRGAFAPLGIDESGWVARYADLYAPTPLGAVSVGVGRRLDFVGGTSNPLLVDDLKSFKASVDPAFPDNHLHRVEAVKDVLSGYSGAGTEPAIAEALLQGHDLADQIQMAVASYSSTVDYGGTNPPNIQRTMRDIATLVQYGFETRIFYTGFGGFDLHGNAGSTTGAQANLLGRLDTALGAFAQDCKDMGVWNDMAIVVISEFGRRNYQNGSGGTDHGQGNAFLVCGGAVNGGTYGADLSEADLNAEYPFYGVDFRDIYREVLQDHLGADPTPVFPESQPTSVTLGLV
jgi:uncharacterized protein (DUF1501 family)